MNAITELSTNLLRWITEGVPHSPTKRRRRSGRSDVAESLERRTLLASQIVSTTPEAQTVAFGDNVDVTINYDVSDSSVSALSFGVLLHYDSSVLTYGGLRAFFTPGDPTIQDGPETQSDGDPETDRVVSISWGNGSVWPPSNIDLPTLLATVRFQAASTETTTSLNITNSDPDPVYDFDAPSVSVVIQPPTFTVGSSLSLADAITAANASATPATIEFESGQTAITLSGALPELTNDISIVGPGAKQLTISAAANQRHFSVAAGNTVNISGLTLDGANAAGEKVGGGIASQGTLNLHEVAIRNVLHSFGNGNSGQGGAVTNDGGTLNISNSELSGNVAQTGGGIHNTGTATIVNSTVSGNSVADAGGGITTSGDNATTTLRNVTVTNNTSAAGRNGGLLDENGGTIVVRNSIIVGNLVSNGSSPDTFPSSVTDVTGSVTAGTASEIIEALDDNGGQTQTHALADGSDAIDAGIDDQAVTTNGDQRGRARIAGGSVDAGAFEVVPNPGFTVTNPATTIVDESGSSVSLSVVLDAPPVGTVVLDITSSDETESRPRFGSVSFGPENWSIPQTIPIEGVADKEVDGDQTSTITVSVNDEASDDQFDLLADHTFSVTTTDDGTTLIALGDLDGNGGVTATDAFLIFHIVSGLPTAFLGQFLGDGATVSASDVASGFNNDRSRFDVDANGSTTTTDAFLIFHVVTGLPTPFLTQFLGDGATRDASAVAQYVNGTLKNPAGTEQNLFQQQTVVSVAAEAGVLGVFAVADEELSGRSMHLSATQPDELSGPGTLSSELAATDWKEALHLDGRQDDHTSARSDQDAQSDGFFASLTEENPLLVLP